MPVRSVLTVRQMKLVAFVGASTILVVGALLAPRAADVAAPLPEPVAPLIAEEVRTQEPVRLVESLRRQLEDAVAATVTFEARPPRRALVGGSADWHLTADGTSLRRTGGLVVSATGDVLTTTAAVAEGALDRILLANGRTGEGRALAIDARDGLALINVSHAGTMPAARLLLGAPVVGQFAAAAGRADGAVFVVPAVLTAPDDRGYGIDGVPPTLPSGTPLFDIEGRAIAIVLRDARGAYAHPIGAALERLHTLIAEHRSLPAAVGVALQRLEPPLQPLAGDAGVLVRDVAPGSPAALAGIVAGDVLQQVGGRDVADPDAALLTLTQLPIGQPATLHLVRRGRARDVAVVPDSGVDAPWLAQADRRGVSREARPARDVFETDVLSRAHIPADADIVTVSGRPPRGMVRVRRPLLVYVDDRGTRYFAVAEPTS